MLNRLGRRTMVGNYTPYGVSVGAGHSLVIVEGSVYAWGMNENGQIGNSTTIDSNIPQKIDNLNNVVAVAWGHLHSMALTQDGDVYFWGHNGCQLGDDSTFNITTPQKINTLSNITMISCSYNHYSMALTNDGEVYSWGNNCVGQLGHGSINRLTTPQKIANLTNIAAIACGDQHSIAITKDGFVYTWGYNDAGQLGNGSTTPSMVPLKIPNLTNVTDIASSTDHVLALTDDGDVYSWGYNGSGELGNGTTHHSPTPQRITNLSNIVAIACGYNHSMALTNNGSVYSWGYNHYGQLGNGLTTNSTIPIMINTVNNVYVIACVGYNSMVLTKEGFLYVWGYNYSGQLGNGVTRNIATVPQKLSLPNGTVQWLIPYSPIPLCPPLNPKLVSHMESLSNTLDVSHNYHQFHTLYTNQAKFYLHKAILEVRAPGLLNLNTLDIESTLFEQIFHFICTDNLMNFEEMKVSQIIQLIHICKFINLMDLLPFCQQALVVSLTNNNSVFDAAIECYSLHLNDELEWIAWFIGNNKLSPPIMNIDSNPGVLSKLTSDSTHSPPMFLSQPRPLEDVMEILFLQKIHCDFTIHFKNTLINVHKFVLAPRWPYFTNIMVKYQSSTIHNSPMPLDIFGKLIQYFYVGAKYLTLRDCGWILYLSEFYLLHDEKSLLRYCDKMVNSQIDSNLSSTLQLAMEIDDYDIEQKAISMIPESIKPQQIISLCLGFIKDQQKIIQAQQKTVQEQQIILNNILENVKSLY